MNNMPTRKLITNVFIERYFIGLRERVIMNTKNENTFYLIYTTDKNKMIRINEKIIKKLQTINRNRKIKEK